MSLLQWLFAVTCRTDLIAMLNGCGHTVSSSELHEIQAALGKLRQEEGAQKLPGNIAKHVQVSLVFDNNEFSEETPSEDGTTYCTNGINIQPRGYTTKRNQNQRKEAKTLPASGNKRVCHLLRGGNSTTHVLLGVVQIAFQMQLTFLRLSLCRWREHMILAMLGIWRN